MKNFHKLTSIVLSLIMTILFSGCSDSDITTNTIPRTGTVALSLTDAPIDDENVKGVHITFTGLRYQYKNTEDTNKNNESSSVWQDVNLSEPIMVNLLALQNGNTTLLNKVELPAGEIQHIRFMLDTKKCYVELNDEGNVSLTVPDGDQTGYKSIGGFIIPLGGMVNLTADFDLRKSIIVIENGGYKLRPTIKLVDNKEVGEIRGNIDLETNASSVLIYVYEDETWDDDQSNANNNFNTAVLSVDATYGSYTLPWLTAGTYDLVVVGLNILGEFEEIIGYIPDVIVVPGTTVTQDIIYDTPEK